MIGAVSRVDDRAAFLLWYRNAKPGDQAIYHTGSVAHYRFDAQKRRGELQSLADQSTPLKSKRRPPGEAIELQQIIDRLELLETVRNFATLDMVALTQRRVEGQEGQFVYCATRKSRT